ncbi:MAG TPA: TonB-dependent receptor [Terriglobales bacterium]|nr:TonB-dependent receptor [Terriglobales bacterium]
MKHPLKLYFAGLLVLFSLTVSGAWAQVDMGSIQGTVKDATGAVIPGAQVTLTEINKSVTRTAVSRDDGTYIFTPLPIGKYRVEVEQKGYKKARSVDIELSIQQQRLVDFTMAVGGADEVMDVTAEAPLLQTQDASVGAVATQVQINNLPLNGRNYTFLAQLNAGVTSQVASRNLEKSGSFVANGLSSVHNNYILDGIDNNNDTVDFLNGAAYVNLPPPDAIQEFKLQTSNFSAEFGRAGGAVINAAIKSGTNQFHGSAWEFIRNDKLDATGLDQYFIAPANKRKGNLKRNQFGVSAGGPIRKNKTFIFGDYEGTRIRTGAAYRATIPTVQEATSGFTDFRDQFAPITATARDLLGRTFNVATILDPATTRTVTAGQVDPVTGLTATANGYVRDPFYTNGSVAGITDFTALTQYLNQLPASRLNANAVRLLQLYPAANAPGVLNNYQVTRTQLDDNNHFDVRVDQHFSNNDQMFGRVSYSRRSGLIPPPFDGDGASYSFGTGNVHDRSLNIAVSETHTFSPTMINELRFGFSHLFTSIEPPSENTAKGLADKYGIPGVDNGGLPSIYVRGPSAALTPLGLQGYEYPNRRTSDTLQLTENLTKLTGAHTFKTGVEYQRMSFPWSAPPYPAGWFTFNGYTGIPNLTNGVGMADLLLNPIAATVPNGVDFVGGASALSVSSVYEPDDLRHYFGAYFQDDWRVTPSLTLNMGLRWEYFGSLQEANGRQAGLMSTDGLTAEYVISSEQKDVPLSPAFTSLLASNNIPLRYVDGSSILDTPLTNFAPRIGLSYQVTPKIVGRASYGMFYGGFENLGGAPDPSSNYPFAVNLSFIAPNSVTPMTYADGNRGTLEVGLTSANPDPASPNFRPQGLSLIAFQKDWRTAYTQQWNASVQYLLTPNQTMTAAYVGNNTHHMLNGAQINQPTQILPPGTDMKPYLQFPDLARNLNFLTTNGSAYYHALQVSFERRSSKGLNLLANYTRSVCKSNNRNILNIGEAVFAQAYMLPGWGLDKAYAYCGSDSPNIFHASGVWELPIGKGKPVAGDASGILDAFIGGWSAQWIYTLQDGFPFSIGCNPGTNAAFGCYALVVPGQDLYLNQGPHGITQFLNPAAFQNPPTATTIGQSDFSPLGGPPTQAHGPGFQNLDFSMFKKFQTSETTNLEFRGEFYNFLNHPNFGNSFRTLDFRNTATFGQITGTRGTGRQVQLALKFYW